MRTIRYSSRMVTAAAAAAVVVAATATAAAASTIPTCGGGADTAAAAGLAAVVARQARVTAGGPCADDDGCGGYAVSPPRWCHGGAGAADGTRTCRVYVRDWSACGGAGVACPDAVAGGEAGTAECRDGRCELVLPAAAGVAPLRFPPSPVCRRSAAGACTATGVADARRASTDGWGDGLAGLPRGDDAAGTLYCLRRVPRGGACAAENDRCAGCVACSWHPDGEPRCFNWVGPAGASCAAAVV